MVIRLNFLLLLVSFVNHYRAFLAYFVCAENSYQKYQGIKLSLILALKLLNNLYIVLM